jgi:hypothetical protein
MNSIAVILLTLFVALFLTSISLYLTFLFKSKELGGRRNRYVIKFIKPYFDRYANERSQNEQIKIIGELIKKTDYRVFFSDLTPSSFKKATVFFGITTFLSIFLAFYYNEVILVIDITIGVAGGFFFVDDIIYFIKLSQIMEDTNNVRDT